MVNTTRLGWLLRYWLLDKYRLQIFVAAAAIALVAGVGLTFELAG